MNKKNKGNSKNSRFYISALCILVVILGFVSCRQLYAPDGILNHVMPGFFDERPQPNQTVEIDWSNKHGARLHMKIPSEYVTSISRDENKELFVVSIESGLPDLSARPSTYFTLAESGKYKLDTEKSKNGILLKIEHHYMDDSLDDFRQGKYRGINQDIESKFAYQIDDQYGLNRYRAMTCGKRDPSAPKSKAADDLSPEGCFDGFIIYSMSKPDDNPFVYINCNVPQGGHLSRCMLTSKYKNYYNYSLFIQSTEISRWQEFNAAAISLMDKFIVN